MRLGLFGGTFDPPHVGHLLVATDALEALSLDRLIWVPTGHQPLKRSAVHATPAQRAEMLEAMLAGDERFGVDRIEIDRPGLSYTVDTLAEYARRHPDDRRFFLIGADLVAQLPQWRAADRLAELAELVVLDRGEVAEGADSYGGRRIATRRVDLSSTEVRERVRAGKPIVGFVTEAVARYIGAAGLYR